MTRTIRNESESDILAGIRRYACVTGRRAKKKRHNMIARRVNARVARIVEAKAQAIVDGQTPDAKPILSWHETWRQRKWSFI